MSMFAMLKLCSRENNFQFSWCLKENLTDGYVVVLVTVVNEVVVSAALVVSVTAPCFGDVDDAYHYHVKIIIWLPGVLPVVLCSDVLDMAVVVVVAFVVGSSFTRFPQIYRVFFYCSALKNDDQVLDYIVIPRSKCQTFPRVSRF